MTKKSRKATFMMPHFTEPYRDVMLEISINYLFIKLLMRSRGFPILPCLESSSYDIITICVQLRTYLNNLRWVALSTVIFHFNSRMRLALKIAYLVATLIGLCSGDTYMHNPRGSNNRLNEQSANRNNANRLFDSQVSQVFLPTNIRQLHMLRH